MVLPKVKGSVRLWMWPRARYARPLLAISSRRMGPYRASEGSSSPWRSPMWSLPSAGAVKPVSRSWACSGAVKAAPWTVTPSSGTSAAVIRFFRNTVTFSGHSTVCQGLLPVTQSWLPGAMNTRACIFPRARASCSPVSRNALPLSNRSPASRTSWIPSRFT